ncbi:MAG: efflux RND transporter periplasmic adaptor subunit [Polyangiales bacterium]
MTRRIVAWLVVLVALAAGTYYVIRWRKAHAVVEPKFKTSKVVKGTVAAKVTATGTLSARITVQVGTQVSGRLMEIFVDFNSPVKKGQVIAKIDPRLFEADVKRARASYMQAQAAVNKAKANSLLAVKSFDRAKALKEQGLMGMADYETAETAVTSAKADIDVANANLEQAAAALSTAQVNLGFTTITAPIDGTVLSRAVDVGQTVAASLQAPVLFTIAQDLRKIQVDTFVAEADVGKLKTGMDATFTVDAFPNKKFKGVVRDVRNAAQTVQNVVTYDAVLDVDNDALELKPGMTANATFVWAEKDEVLTVPNSALRFQPPPEVVASASASASPSGSGSAPRPHKWDPDRKKEGGGKGSGENTRKTVWVLRDGMAHPVRVTVGVTDGTTTEVVSGDLHEGDEVIIEYIAPADGSSTGTTKSPLQPGGGAGGGGAGGRGGRAF